METSSIKSPVAVKKKKKGEKKKEKTEKISERKKNREERRIREKIERDGKKEKKERERGRKREEISRSLFFFTKFSASRATDNQFQQSNSLISSCFLFYLLFLNLLS